MLVLLGGGRERRWLLCWSLSGQSCAAIEQSADKSKIAESCRRAYQNVPNKKNLGEGTKMFLIKAICWRRRDKAEAGSRKPPRPPPEEKLTWTHPMPSNALILLEGTITFLIKTIENCNEDLGSNLLIMSP